MAMAGYEVVDPPRGLSYAGPAIDFGIIGNLANDYYKGKQDRRQEDIATAFKDGLPTDPATGQPDYGKIMQVLAQKGAIGSISQLAPTQLDQSQRNQAGQMSPLLGGGGPAPSSGPITSQPIAAPQSMPVRGGGDSAGSVVDLVTAKLPQDSPTTGTVIGNIARAVGVDPNAPLTPDQSARVARLTEGYVQRTAATRPAAPPPQPAPPAQPAPAPMQVASAAPADTFAQRFAGASSSDAAPPAQAQPKAPERTGGYVPPPPQRPPQPAPAAPMQQPQGQAGQQPVAPQGPAAQAPMPPQGASAQGGRITPAVPLPPGYTDPQKAILALRREAARLSANPRAAGQVKELDAWATRIESSLQPISVGDRILSPTGQTLYAAPEKPVSVGGALVRPSTGEVVYQSSGTLSGQALEGAAERYYQTGQFPSGMTRDSPSNRADRLAIQQRAYERGEEDGISPADLPSRWQQFATRAAGMRTFEQRAAGLTLAENEAKTLIPRVREISNKISRTEYPTLNSLILAAEKGTGGTDVIRLGIAVGSLIPVYARVLKPVGQVTEGDTNRALDILNKAWSRGQIDAALDQMGIELDSAKAALKNAREDFGTGPTHRDVQKPPSPATPSAASGAGDAKVIRWERGPDGNLRPAQ